MCSSDLIIPISSITTTPTINNNTTIPNIQPTVIHQSFMTDTTPTPTINIIDENPTRIPGFNPNICNDLSKPACMNDMNKNMKALNSFYQNNFLEKNKLIHNNYTNLQKEIYQDFIKRYNVVNINPQYDAIDIAGELIDVKYNKSLLSGMIYDIKDQMMGENTKYILINLLSATVFVTILALAP